MVKVFTIGVFDYFHIGHLRLFERAKKLGDYLIVAVQDGNHILNRKPDAKVLYSTEERCYLLRALRVVDEVIVYEEVETIVPQVDFDILVVGGDQNHDGFKKVIQWCEENGRQVVYLPRTPGICSSDIKKNL